MKCLVEWCKEKARAKGMCNMHYQRKIRNIPMEGNKKPTLIERIMDKVSKQDNGCWLWVGAKGGDNKRTMDGRYNYAYINANGKVDRVHRVMYEIVNQERIDGYHVLHRCDNPLCVNPDHLFKGTHQDNMDDMIAKKRARHPHGEANHSKLTTGEVIEIKRMRGDGKTYLDIANRFEVHPQTVANIVKGKKWAHLS